MSSLRPPPPPREALRSASRPRRAMNRLRLTRHWGFAAAAYAFAVNMLGTTLPTPLYGIYQQRFGFSELMITVIFATYAAGVIAALILFGRLSDQIGRRRAPLPGLGFSALSAVAFLLAQGLAPLLVGRVLSGLSAGIFTGTPLPPSWTSPGRSAAGARRSSPRSRTSAVSPRVRCLLE